MATVQVPQTEPQASVFSQIPKYIRWAKAGVGVVAFFFALSILSEGFRLYRFAADIHPIAGYGSLLLMAVCLGLVGFPILRMIQLPRIVEPPKLPENGKIERKHLLAECRYLDRYLANCARNPEMASQWEDIRVSQSEVVQMRTKIKSAADAEIPGLETELWKWSEKALGRVLDDVDQKVDRMIYREALAVGVATAASPNGTLDSFVMLWRSVKLVSQISVYYYGRPGVLGSLAVCRDVSIATALAGFLQNATQTLGGLVANSVGGVTGVVAGPAVDGITNALVLIRLGHLAKNRCRSVRQWDAATRQFAVIDALAATQRIAVGLSAEILRQAGTGAVAVAGAVVSGLASAANAAAEGLGNVAGSAVNAASAWKDRLGGYFRATVKSAE